MYCYCQVNGTYQERLKRSIFLIIRFIIICVKGYTHIENSNYILVDIRQRLYSRKCTSASEIVRTSVLIRSELIKLKRYDNTQLTHSHVRAKVRITYGI